jgi:hypothetical protein
MSRQITLDKSIQGIEKLKLDDSMSISDKITEDSTIICGRCGSAMKQMGPANKRKDDYDGLIYEKGTWQLSCRACGMGSAKIKLNPIPPMLELDDEQYFQEDSKGNIIEIDNGSGNNIIMPLSNTVKKNGYRVHKDTFDAEKHKEIDEPSTEVDTEQIEIFKFS